MPIELNVLLCDDNEQFLQSFQKLLEQVGDSLSEKMHLHVCTNIRSVQNITNDIHIAFLDIEMPESQNGFRIADFIAQHHPNALIIFVTSHDQYWKPALKVQPFEYINKSDLEAELPSVLAKAIAKLPGRGFIYLYDRKALIRKSKILYLENDKHYVWLHFLEGAPAMEKGSVTEWQTKLGKTSFFICRKGLLANLEHVESCDVKGITLVTGDVLPLSRRQKKAYKGAAQAFLDAFGRYD